MWRVTPGGGEGKRGPDNPALCLGRGRNANDLPHTGEGHSSKDRTLTVPVTGRLRLETPCRERGFSPRRGPPVPSTANLPTGKIPLQGPVNKAKRPHVTRAQHKHAKRARMLVVPGGPGR